MSVCSNADAISFAADAILASKALGIFPSWQVSPYGPFFRSEFNIARDAVMECQFKTKRQKIEKKEDSRKDMEGATTVFVFRSFLFRA